MGTEKALTSTIVDVINGEGNPDKPAKPDPPSPASANHKALAAANSYGWTRTFGTAEQKKEARSRVKDLFAHQNKGHYTWGGANEILTASHYNWWGTALAALRWYARKAGDAEVVDLTSRWWRGEMALLSLVSVPFGKLEGQIVSPGARTRYNPSKPASGGDTARDVVYSLIMGLQANKKKEDWYQKAASKESLDTVAAWIVRKLVKDGDDFGGAKQAGLRALDGNKGDLPKMQARLKVVRTGNGHVAWFDEITGTDGPQAPQFWAWCNYGTGDQEYGLTMPANIPPKPLDGFEAGKRIEV